MSSRLKIVTIGPFPPLRGGISDFHESLVIQLSKRNDVTVLDFKESKISGVNFVKIDIENSNEIIDSTKEIDLIIHLAASLGVVETEKNPVKTLDVNAIGTKNVLDIAYNSKVKRVVHISSTAVYGIPDHHPIFETDKLSVNSNSSDQS